MAEDKKPKRQLPVPLMAATFGVAFAAAAMWYTTTLNPTRDYGSAAGGRNVSVDTRTAQGKRQPKKQVIEVPRDAVPQATIDKRNIQNQIGFNGTAEAQGPLVTSVTVGNKIKFSESGEFNYFDATVNTNKGPVSGKVPEYILSSPGVEVVRSIAESLSPLAKFSPGVAEQIARDIAPALQNLRAQRKSSNLLQAQVDKLDYELGG